jgi:hypothetical protein
VSLRQTLHWAVAAGFAAWMLCGCSTIRQVFHSGDQSSKQAEALKVLQLKNMRFADEYVGSIQTPIRLFQASTENAQDRLTAQNWMVSQATAAYTIASGPSPVVNAVDMVVLATLSRMVIEDAWSSERFGDRAAPLLNAYRRLEPLALDIANTALPPDQIAALQQIIVRWREQNPHVTAISYVHFRDVAASMGHATDTGGASTSGLFGMLGLDPFSSLDPAVREITQTRELAERTIYYAQHVPNLLDMQAERLSLEFAAMPETKRMLDNADLIAGAANTTGRVVGELPNLLTQEREAAIRQFMDAITLETGHTRQLVAELHGALEAGTVTANSLTASIQAFDQLMARFDKPAVPGAAQSSSRPFNITEYTAAAAEITRAAAQLQGLIGGVEQGSPALINAADHASLTMRQLIDHAYLRILELIGVVLLGGLAVMLVYRGISRRFIR